MKLTNRDNIVHKCLIQHFIRSAQPVSSKVIAQDRDCNISPATIRSIMARLEESGLIMQPHVSAGRIPTDKGYRYYIDRLMDKEKLSAHEKETITDRMQSVPKEVFEVLEQASRLLGLVSKQLGIVLSPHFFEGKFQKLELIPVSSNKILFVLSIMSGSVRTVIAKIDTEIPDSKLQIAAQFINEKLYGFTLKEIKEALTYLMREHAGIDPKLLNVFWESVDDLFNFDNNERLYWKGIDNIIHQPEFSKENRLKHLFDFIENEDRLRSMLKKRSQESQLCISIGTEHQLENITNCSIITTDYIVGSVRGTIGIIGPTRMKYSKIIPLVKHMADLINTTL